MARTARRGESTCCQRSTPPAQLAGIGQAGDPGGLGDGRLDGDIGAGLKAGPEPSGDQAPHAGTGRAAEKVNPSWSAGDNPRRLAG